MLDECLALLATIDSRNRPDRWKLANFSLQSGLELWRTL
jgi:hypothetical protein